MPTTRHEGRSGLDLNIRTRAEIDAAIATVSVHAPNLVPVLREIRAGRLAMVQPMRDGIVSMRRLKIIGKPVLFLIGDDDHASTGPDGWACAEKAIGWANQIIIHGAAGRVEEYGAAALAAQVTGRLLLIECCSEGVEVWFQAAERWARHAVCQRVVPPAGTQHPAPVPRESMQ